MTRRIDRGQTKRMLVLVLAIVTALTGGRTLLSERSPTRAQSVPSAISVSFDGREIWQPSQDAIRALHACGTISFTCVRTVMQSDGATQDAIDFYHLTGWF